MALKRGSVIPSDAVILDETEATNYIWDIITGWDKISDTWALRYGATILGGINAFSGLYINRHYRWKFRLGTYGFLATTAPTVIMPGLLTTTFHRQFITTDILLMKDKCPICYEVRSMALQVGLGLLYPMILAPAGTLMLASRHATFRIPLLSEGPKVMLNFLKQHTKSLTGALTYLFAIQIIGSSAVSYYEIQNNVQLQSKLNVLEEKLIRDLEKKGEIL